MLESRGFRVYSIAGYVYWCLSPVSNRRVGLYARNEKCKITQYLFWDFSKFVYPNILLNNTYS